MNEPSSNDTKRPVKPERPLPEECCGSGCVPCIYDYYYAALDKWKAAVDEADREQSEV